MGATKIVSPKEWLSLQAQHREVSSLSPVEALTLTLPPPPVPGAVYGGEVNGIRYWITPK